MEAPPATGSSSSSTAPQQQQGQRLMLSCDNCRRKKIRCTGDKPSCTSCRKATIFCHYSPVGPRKKPRRPTTPPPGAHTAERQRRGKRQMSGSQASDDESHGSAEGLGSVSHLMLERVRQSNALEHPGGQPQPPQQQQTPVIEMLRLQTQISALVEQLRDITIRASGVAAGAESPGCSPAAEALSAGAEADHGAGSPGRRLAVSRDLVTHLTDVYFQYCHPSETGMYPADLYRDRLRRAQVGEPFLLSVLAVAARFSDDPRVHRDPAYLAGHDFYERTTRLLMMDVLDRDCVENMLTLNNLAVYAVGLPVANRAWYFSGLAMRMATQMSLQKVDAPGRMPGASMMSGPGIESARRAFWTTLLLEALASFASGEPPPITVQDVHVAEPHDDPPLLADSDASARPLSPGQRSGVSNHIAQLSLLLIRVARLNGNRHPETAQFSPEYAALHAEMVAWYHGLPDAMQIRSSVARDEIQRDPQGFAAKMFVHCHYQAAIIALHQPRVDLVRVGTAEGFGAKMDDQWRQLAQQQCLTAACTMTELLTLSRALDVRYHMVTFGFAVFMAGVVHVGAVAYTPASSTERQYSINCVREHVRCLDRLGKYYAFHFIMAKHIRAQLQVIEAADVGRRKDVARGGAVGMPFGMQVDSAFGAAVDMAAMGLDASMFGASSSGGGGASWPFSVPTSVPPAPAQDIPAASPSASMDMFLGLFSTQSPVPPSAQPAASTAASAVSLAAGLQGLQGMGGLGSGIGSLAHLFASADGAASLYPENLVNSSALAPGRQGSAEPQVDPAAPLRLTTPGGMQQFGSLPPFSPL
ncbi:hypothetical protein GGI15_000057 [Coemansia interrupta]|uniref:Zn(2)-C6 fungal-type domain-containing protein n=1 Tax=Coemansia interrupta TaxID=1126814 RepID=A0A9W8HMQ6_9FUNG|nr:hypothetical protein GGI15_000057 [Coemansia interrupta]